MNSQDHLESEAARVDAGRVETTIPRPGRATICPVCSFFLRGLGIEWPCAHVRDNPRGDLYLYEFVGPKVTIRKWGPDITENGEPTKENPKGFKCTHYTRRLDQWMKNQE
jgi:hypothetical protein